MGETRVDLLHLLEDLRDAYPGAAEETILTEIVANALDSGAATIRLATDPTAPALTIVDDGAGMRGRDLARYHDIAATTKVRGAGIGFAGVGVKIALLTCAEVITETRRGKQHVASSWRLASRHKAPWRRIPPPGFVSGRGTAVRLVPTSALSPLLDPGFVEGALRRNFQPLFDPGLDGILNTHYPRGVAFLLNGQAVERATARATEVASIVIRTGRKRRPAGAGHLVRQDQALPEEMRGIAVSTFGKVIRRGWDWLALAPAAAERIGGIIEVPALAECLTLNKADFIRAGARGATYLAYRKAIQEVVSKQLAEWGDAGKPPERARRRAARPVERDLEGVRADLAGDFPLLATLVEQRAGGQRRLPTAGAGSANLQGASVLGGPPPLATSTTPPDEAAPGPASPSETTGRLDVSPAPPARPPAAPEPPAERDVADTARASRTVRYGLSIEFDARPADRELARLIESTVWVNEAHPAYRRASVSRSEGYHVALAVALALASLAVDPAREHAFVVAFLSRWGEAIDRRQSRWRRPDRERAPPGSMLYCAGSPAGPLAQYLSGDRTDRLVAGVIANAMSLVSARASDAPHGARGLVLALTPGGALVLREDPDAAPLESAIAERIQGAFARGAGYGLLDLGAALADAPLPPGLAFWRDVGRAFVARLCALPDLEANRKRLKVPFPEDDMASRLRGAPPMPGGEYLGPGGLAALWDALNEACREELAQFDGTAEAYLQSRSEAWHLVGRVHFHLAENRADASAPFAFLATYTTRLGARGKPRHRPLGEAIREYAGAGNRGKLLALLEPVQRAAGRSALLRDLVDWGDVYRPLALSPDEAYRFLKDIPAFEESGVVVRVPDWWSARRPPRPQVQVTVGSKAPGSFGTDALLDFDVRVTLDGQALTDADLEQVAASTQGLALIHGKWVELDGPRLREALEHWKKVKAAARADGLGFIEGMRLLSGAALDDGAAAPPPPEAAEWSRVIAGRWLQDALDGLRGPDGLREVPRPRDLRAELRPYQRVGVRWLALLQRLGLGACLADDMGLGKTLQVLALLLTRRERPETTAPARRAALLVVPASLIANWRAEIDRFAPSLRVAVAHPSMAEKPMDEMTTEDAAGVDLVITTYGFVHRLRWVAETQWPLVVLDEAQAIKNPGTRQTRAVKGLRARSRIALTGTPVENRLGDLWSLFDFLNPGLLGSARAFTSFVKQLGARPGGYAPLRELTRPYILRRLKTDRQVIADLPDKTEMRAYCGLTKLQAALYQQSVRHLAETLERVAGIERRGAILASLLRLKQICNHPSHWLKDDAWTPEASGKFARLRELAEVVADKQEKALVFTQFREMAEPLARFLEGVFGRSGLVMHGSTPVRERRELVERFQDDANAPFFVLSLKVGGTGLNLTAASHVIHFDRWWNPAVEDQATDRAFRIGQKRNVLVHKFVCRGTVEERIDAMIAEKLSLARHVLQADGGTMLTELSDAELLRVVALDLTSALQT